MKKLMFGLIIIAVLGLLIVNSISIFAKTTDETVSNKTDKSVNKTIRLNVGESFKVTKEVGGFVGITWNYTNSNPKVVDLDYEISKQIPGTADMLLPHTWSFKALKSGTSIIKFKPNRVITEGEETYKIIVRSKKNTTTVVNEPVTIIDNSASGNFDKTKVLFIEEVTNKNGVELVSGPEPPILAIDFPTYNYTEGKLTSWIKSFDMTDKVVGIMGTYNSLSGYSGMGAASRLSPLTFATKANNLKISPDGTAKFLYSNDWITVAPGEEMVVMKESLTKMDESTVKVLMTKTYRNFGFIDKSNVIFPE